VGLGRFFSSLIHTQPVWLLGRGINHSKGRYLHTEQHKHIIYAHIYPSSRIRTHDTSVQAGEDCSCLGPRGNCSRLSQNIPYQNNKIVYITHSCHSFSYSYSVSFSRVRSSNLSCLAVSLCRSILYIWESIIVHSVFIPPSDTFTSTLILFPISSFRLELLN
jgi:hypothetical protein